MPFETLPEFTQGGVGRPEMGSQGIPLESFQAPPENPGQAGAMPPAAEALIGREVDTLMGVQPTPPPQPAASAPPIPQPAAPAAPAPWPDAPRVQLNTSERSLEDRIRAVASKYGGNFERLAEAHVHSEAARTRAQQDRNGDVAALRDSVGRLERLILEGRSAAVAPVRPAPNGQGYGTYPVAPTGAPQIDAEFFQRDPAAATAAVIQSTVGPMIEETVSRHNRALVDSLARARQEDRAEMFRNSKAAELNRLRPIMEQLYSEDPNLYAGLYPEHVERLLLKAALDREEALRARAFYGEIQGALGGNGGTPGGPAPPAGGALPASGGASARRPGAGPATGNWSETPGFNRLWRSPSDSVQEMGALTDVLHERGFGEHLQ